MPIPISSLKVLVPVAGAALLYLLVGGLSPAIAACQYGTDKNGNCLCPPGHPTGTTCGVVPPRPSAGCYVDQPPRGSYQRSCDGIKWDCKMLSAQCKPRQGPAQATMLDPSKCVGDIANMDGQLHCSMGASPPGGSYKDSCRDIWVAGGDLHAQCRDRGGNWTGPWTLSNYASCRNGIDNINGHLQCR